MNTFSSKFIVSFLFFLLLCSCSSKIHRKYLFNDNAIYSNSQLLTELKAPTGVVLPFHNHNYEIPSIHVKKNLEENKKKSDIHPPI